MSQPSSNLIKYKINKYNYYIYCTYFRPSLFSRIAKKKHFLSQDQSEKQTPENMNKKFNKVDI